MTGAAQGRGAGRRGWRWVWRGVWWGLLAMMVVGGLVFLVSTSQPDEQYEDWHLPEGMVLSFHQVVTDPNEKIEIVPWNKALRRFVPGAVYKALSSPAFLSPFGEISVGTVTSKPDLGIGLVFKVKEPVDWLKPGTEELERSRYHDVENILRGTSLKVSHDSDSGWESRASASIRPSMQTVMVSNTVGESYVKSFVFAVIPRNRLLPSYPEVTLDLMLNAGVAGTTEPEVLYSLQLPNPAYDRSTTTAVAPAGAMVE